MKRAILIVAAGLVVCAAVPAHAVLILPSDHQAARAPVFGTLAIGAKPGRSSPTWADAEPVQPGAILKTGVAVWDADVTMSPFLRDRQTRDGSNRNGPPSRGGDEERATPSRLPEPASWAMMLLGFSALGFTLRRRPKTSARIRFS